MNIIYELKNLTNNKKYIGQKVECRIENIDGINVIINTKTELPYFGSSSNIKMIEDMKTCKFEASVLEVVSDRRKMCEREDYWIKYFNAVKSEEYYNLTYSLNYQKRDFQNSIKNEFGETYKDFASRESSLVKRINSAKKVGFTTLEDFYLDIYKKLQIETNLAAIARSYNIERHTISRLLNDVDINKFYQEVQNFSTRLKNKIIDFRTKGASIKMIAIILKLEFATVLFYIGTSNFREKTFSVSKRKGLTEDELGYKIMKKFLEGESFNVISRDLALNRYQTFRSFYRFIRKHVEISDFNGI